MGLVTAGSTTHYRISYEDRFSRADGQGSGECPGRCLRTGLCDDGGLVHRVVTRYSLPVAVKHRTHPKEEL